MPKHAFDPDATDLGLLAAELSERLGRPVAVSQDASDDDDRSPLPSFTLLDPETGLEIEDGVDGRTVAGVVRAHRRPEPPPTPEQAQQAREAALAAAEAKATAGDTAGALADLFALLRADTPTADGTSTGA
jgi:hypothetical protein